jgi:hypothetical protein
MDYSQQNSVFQPGLTARGPVYNANTFGALPTLSPMVKYGIMAALLYLGTTKKLPFGMAGGAAAALAVWKFLPDASPSAGAPSAADIAKLTANAVQPVSVDTSSISMPGFDFAST